MANRRFIIIGGFLGAGKTTAIARLARHLSCNGRRVGLITNDQSENLVDSARLRAERFAVEEITGGCFCCRFDSLVGASRRLSDSAAAPDVLIAEPVGSCTDLKATVAYPLRQIWGEDYQIAPYSVLVDPARCRQMLDPAGGRSKLSEKVAYVYRKQIEEAEFIVVNKVDLLGQVERNDLCEMLQRAYPQARTLEVSCKTGEGIEVWFEEVLGRMLGRRQPMSIDYDEYADGEARLGWVNATLAVRASGSAVDADRLLESLAEDVRQRLRRRAIEVAHLKMSLSPGNSPTELASISLTAADSPPHPTALMQYPLEQGVLMINLRGEGPPEVLRDEALAAAMNAAGIECQVLSADAFRPARPVPTHRIGSIA